MTYTNEEYQEAIERIATLTAELEAALTVADDNLGLAMRMEQERDAARRDCERLTKITMAVVGIDPVNYAGFCIFCGCAIIRMSEHVRTCELEPDCKKLLERLAAAQAEIAALQELLAEMVQDIPSESHQERVIDRIHNLEDEIAARDAHTRRLKEQLRDERVMRNGLADEMTRLIESRDTLTTRVRELEAALAAVLAHFDVRGPQTHGVLIVAQSTLAASATTEPAPDIMCRTCKSARGAVSL